MKEEDTEWRSIDWDSCQDCGNDLMALTCKSNEQGHFNDSDVVWCVMVCGYKSQISMQDNGELHVR